MKSIRNVIPLLLLFLSCFNQSGPERTSNYIAPQPDEVIVVAQCGENYWEDAREQTEVYAGDIFQDGSSLLSGEDSWILLMDDRGSLFFLGEQSKLSFIFEDSQPLLYFYQGSLSVDCTGPLNVVNQEFQLLAHPGQFDLAVNTQGVVLSIYSGLIRMLPGSVSMDLIDRLFRDRWPLLNDRWQSHHLVFQPEREYSWRHQYFRPNSRIISTIFELSQSSSTSEENLSDLLRDYSYLLPPPGGPILEDNRFAILAAHLREELESSEVLYQRIDVSPAEASISLGPYFGQGMIEFPISLESVWDLRIWLRGYEQVEQSFEGQVRSVSFNYQLEKKSSQNYIISVEPPDGMIYVNDLFAGKGQLVVNQKPGEQLDLMFRMEGYNSQILHLEDIGIYPSELHISLNKTLHGEFFVSYEDPVGLCYYSDNFYVADRKGNITAVRASNGLRPWGVATSNSPNDWSSPVAAHGFIYFSGRRVLSVYDPKSGEALGVYPLNAQSIHQYGRRITAFGNAIALPTNDSIILLTADLSRTLKVIPIPGGSLMTPFVHDDHLYTVGNDGRIYKIDRNGVIVETSFSNAFSPLGMVMASDGISGFFCDRQGLVVAFRLDTLELVWQTQLPDQGRLVFRDPMLDEDILYIYSEGYLYSFDSEKGDFLEILNHRFLTPPLVSGGLLYAAVDSGEFIIDDLITGDSLLSLDLAARPTSPVFADQGMVALGMENGRIMVIHQPGREVVIPESQWQ